MAYCLAPQHCSRPRGRASSPPRSNTASIKAALERRYFKSYLNSSAETLQVLVFARLVEFSSISSINISLTTLSGYCWLSPTGPCQPALSSGERPVSSVFSVMQMFRCISHDQPVETLQCTDLQRSSACDCCPVVIIWLDTCAASVHLQRQRDLRLTNRTDVWRKPEHRCSTQLPVGQAKVNGEGRRLRLRTFGEGEKPLSVRIM